MPLTRADEFDRFGESTWRKQIPEGHLLPTLSPGAWFLPGRCVLSRWYYQST